MFNLKNCDVSKFITVHAFVEHTCAYYMFEFMFFAPAWFFLNRSIFYIAFDTGLKVMQIKILFTYNKYNILHMFDFFVDGD